MGQIILIIVGTLALLYGGRWIAGLVTEHAEETVEKKFGIKKTTNTEGDKK